MRIHLSVTVLTLAFSLAIVKALLAQDSPVDLEAEWRRRLENVEAEIAHLKLNHPLSSDRVLTGTAVEKPKLNYPTFTPFGAIQSDAGWFQQSLTNRALVGDAVDGIGIRRARLGGFGKVSEQASYRLQMDFAFPGRPTFTDVFIDLHEVPVLGNVRFGQWKQFIGLQELTSFRFNPFLERASLFLFNPFRRTGVGFYNHAADERWTWAASVFGAGQDQFGDSLTDIRGYAMAGRITCNPVFECDGERVLHLGAAYHLSAPTDRRVRFGAFGGNAPPWGLFSGQVGTASFNQTPSFVDTGFINAHLYQVFATELAIVMGPLSLQAELNYTLLEQVQHGSLSFWGGYLFATYFLTGQHRVYDRKQALFDRPAPLNDWRPLSDGNLFGGAWELTARLAYIDLTDQNIDGGRLADLTLGINWYLNRYTRITFNYIHALLQRGDSTGSHADIYAVRIQLDF